MSSEIITKNDLKAILDTALPTQPVLSDTGWITPTLNSAFTHYADNQQVQYRRVGQVVQIRGAAKPTAQIAAGGSATIFTLPLGFRPSRRVNSLEQGSDRSIWLMNIDPDTGNVLFERYRNGDTAAAATTSFWMNTNMTFLVENQQWPVTPVTTADYVIEQQGPIDSGGWSYKKWASGRAELWYRQNPGSYACTTARGSWYSGADLELTYPFPLVELATEVPAITGWVYLATDAYIAQLQLKQLSKTGCTVRIVASGSIAANNGYIVMLHVEGRWK